MLKGRNVTYYRWGTVIQAAAFLSSFLNMDICIFVQNICDLRFARLFRTLYIIQHPFPTVSLFSLILHHPQQSISRQIFEHRENALGSWAEMHRPCHWQRLPNRMDHFMVHWEVAPVMFCTKHVMFCKVFTTRLIIFPQQTFCLKGWVLLPYLWAFLTGWSKRVKSEVIWITDET